MTIARKQCVRCGGSGTVLRERRKMADGQPDPLDFRMSEVCTVCGGEGSVRNVPGADRAVRTGGWLADQIVVEKTSVQETIYFIIPNAEVSGWDYRMPV